MEPEDEAVRLLSVQSVSWQTVVPHRERGMLLCDKGVRADKHICVKCCKDELYFDNKGRVSKDGS